MYHHESKPSSAPTSVEKKDEIEHEVYDEFLSTELSNQQNYNNQLKEEDDSDNGKK